jgi:hypothetical protein
MCVGQLAGGEEEGGRRMTQKILEKQSDLGENFVIA